MFIRTASFIALLLAGNACSTKGTPPPWLQNPSSSCPAELLCALGEGSSWPEAEKNARKSLAQIFETRVTGSTEYLSSQERVRYQREHIETFDEILQGVQILHRHRNKKRFFALAFLHKKKSAQSLAHRAKHHNSNLLRHYRENDLDGFTATLKLHRALEERYFILTGKPLPPRIGYKKMLEKVEKIRAFRAKKMILVEATTSGIRPYLIKNLVQQGYRTTDQKNRPYDIKLVAQMDVRQLHLNVSQFKKYEFSLQINAYNPQEIQKNVLSLKQVQIGRSEAHAKELAMKNIFMGLERKIDPLLKE